MSTRALTIRENWWLDSMQCDACGAGNYSLEGATTCLVVSDSGSCRSNSETACTYCEEGYYAANKTTGASMLGLQHELRHTIESAIPCPNWPNYVVCEPCLVYPDNAHSVAGFDW